MLKLPLINHFSAHQTIAIRQGKTISALHFINSVENLCKQLPDKSVMINLCEDRYQFILSFASALIKKQTMVLPADRTEKTILNLQKAHPNSYIICDNENQNKSTLEQICLNKVDLSKTTGHSFLTIPKIPANQIAAILYTSGSSGNPMPNKKTWGSLVKGAQLVAQRLGIKKGSSIVATVPPQHMFGFETTVLLPMQCGLNIEVSTPLFPYEIADNLNPLSGNKILITTPLQIRACVADKTGLNNLDFTLSSTAPLETQLAKQLEQQNLSPVYEIYGSTETGAIATRQTASEDAWLALEGVKLQQQDSAWFVSGGHIYSPQKISDYLRTEGDRFYLIGRDSDLIKIAGKRISLLDLNSRLKKIKGIQEGIFFVAQEQMQATQRLALIVVAPDLTRKQLCSELKTIVDNAFMPRPIIFVDHLPRTAVGKIQKKQLESIYLKHKAAKQ